MASDIAPAGDTIWWTLPPEFEGQWKTLVHAFGLVESYPDEPLGNGVLRTPKTFSDEQAKVLIDVLKLAPETVAIRPGSYTPRNMPPLSAQVFEMLTQIDQRVHPPFGLTIMVKETINRLAGRQWTQLPTSYFLPKERREAERLGENERLVAIRERLKKTPLPDLIGEMLGARPAAPRRAPDPA